MWLTRRNLQLVAQFPEGVPTVQKGRLQNWVAGEITLYTRSKDAAAGLPLQVRISADMVGVGVGIVDNRQAPAVGIQDLLDFPSRILVIATVDETDIIALQAHQTDLGRALYVVIAVRDLHQFVHNCCSPFHAGGRSVFLPLS